MTDRRFYLLVLISVVALIGAAVLGLILESLTWLFEIVLAVAGWIAGYVTSKFFEEKSKRQDLGRYASSGFRLSVCIYDSLGDIVRQIEELKVSTENKGRTSNSELNLRFDIVSGELRVLQRFSLSANDQWKGVLPPEQQQELRTRERVIDISDLRELQIIEEIHPLQG